MSDADVRYLHEEKARARRRLHPDPKLLARIRELGGSWPVTIDEYLEMLEARRG